jgi:hypothetical protein
MQIRYYKERTLIFPLKNKNPNIALFLITEFLIGFSVSQSMNRKSQKKIRGERVVAKIRSGLYL